MARRWRRWGAAVLRLPGRIRTRWRRSLQFRVVAVTMVLSIVVAVGLGEFVADRVARGLQTTRFSVATGIAESGFQTARDELSSNGSGSLNSTNLDDASRALFTQLNNGSAGGRLYQVALEFTGDNAGAITGSTPGFDPSSLPSDFQTTVQAAANANQIFSVYATLQETSQSGSPVEVPAVLFGQRVSPAAG